jgi:hypothetical protein
MALAELLQQHRDDRATRENEDDGQTAPATRRDD